MGDGMKFNIDDTKTIIQALEELKGTHCYNHYEDDYEWEQSFEKRWADEIDAIVKRFKKSLKLKELYQRAQLNEVLVSGLKNNGRYEGML